MESLSWLLAFDRAADKSNRLLGDVLPWLIVLIAVVLVGGVAIYLIRRRLRDEIESSGDGFTLHDLRELHAAGELTDAEFQRAKAMMIGRIKSAGTDGQADPPPGNSAV